MAMKYRNRSFRSSICCPGRLTVFMKMRPCCPRLNASVCSSSQCLTCSSTWWSVRQAPPNTAMQHQPQMRENSFRIRIRTRQQLLKEDLARISTRSLRSYRKRKAQRQTQQEKSRRSLPSCTRASSSSSRSRSSSRAWSTRRSFARSRNSQTCTHSAWIGIQGKTSGCPHKQSKSSRPN